MNARLAAPGSFAGPAPDRVGALGDLHRASDKVVSAPARLETPRSIVPDPETDLLPRKLGVQERPRLLAAAIAAHPDRR
jgi:hypothetical protein